MLWTELRTKPDSRSAVRPAARAAAVAPAAAAPGNRRWVAQLQRLAGNRAVTGALTAPALQRVDPAPATTSAPGPSSPVGPSSVTQSAIPPDGRKPTPEELEKWGSYFPNLVDAETGEVKFRILRPEEPGYNCFAWAVGSTSTHLTSGTVEEAGFKPDVDGWSRFLATRYGFARQVDGLDESSDLVLYGPNPTWLWHAARRADVAFGRMTFSSKIGGGNNPTPVILHAPGDLQGKEYGSAQRSFWRGGAPPAGPAAPPPAP